MSTRADDVTLPENILSLSESRRTWNGVRVDVTEWRCSGMVTHQFRHQSETRLIALLEEIGRPSEPRLRENQPCRIGYLPGTWTSLPPASSCGATAPTRAL